MPKVSALNQITPAYEDLLYLVNDPSGTPDSAQATLADLFKAGRIYPPEMFGAAGDGSTDDRAAVQAAVDAAGAAGGGIIPLTAAYKVDQESSGNSFCIEIDVDNIAFVGPGSLIFGEPAGTTEYSGIWVYNSSADTPLGTTNYRKNFIISGVTLDGTNVTGSNLTHIGSATLRLQHAYNFTVENCYFIECWAWQICSVGSSRVGHIIANIFKDMDSVNSRASFRGDGAQSHIIANNTVINGVGSGVLLQANLDNGDDGDVKYNLVANNHIYGAVANGLRIKGGEKNWFVGNYVFLSNGGATGISIDSYGHVSTWKQEASDNWFIGNLIEKGATGGLGIEILGDDSNPYDSTALPAQRNRVINNVFMNPSGNFATHIDLGEQAADNIIANNYFEAQPTTARLSENASASGNIVTWPVLVGSTRPTDPTEGMQFFDTDDGIPIWYDGSDWVDAAGSTV